MKSQLFTICYQRTATRGKNCIKQINATNSFIQKYNSDCVLEFSEEAVGSLTFAQRPMMIKLIELIKKGQVGRLIVYSKERITRNANEFADFMELVMKHQVQVVFLH